MAIKYKSQKNCKRITDYIVNKELELLEKEIKKKVKK